MEALLKVLKRVKSGPKTTFGGAALTLFALYLIYSSEATLTWVSLEAGLFIIGIILFFSNDITPSKEENDEETTNK